MACRIWRSTAAFVVLMAALPLMASCESASTAPPPSASESTHGPITAEVNQSRDQYGKQAILIQLTNATDTPLSVSGAELASDLFNGAIIWTPADGTLELPPRQPKSLPAKLPGAACAGQFQGATAMATVHYADAGGNEHQTTIEAGDPFKVLQRNSEELCLATAAAAVATMVLAPDLDIAADRKTAVVQLVVTPAAPAGETKTLTIESVDGTTLLAEEPTDPWPRNVTITPGSGLRVLPLRIRPARCDPHAVAEDKVGTLLPLRVAVGDRKGVLKIAASTELRGRIYDFVTAACQDV
ncbi:hypothetical protein ACIPY2_12785 [Paenarthrobacter sp. NPDC089675]|uniref:hypothetical protein n=1 Tax=Paenarthrobacter sp. NPDC089675 TaxID=3364376 RepID=UPI0038298FC6